MTMRQRQRRTRRRAGNRRYTRRKFQQQLDTLMILSLILLALLVIGGGAVFLLDSRAEVPQEEPEPVIADTAEPEPEEEEEPEEESIVIIVDAGHGGSDQGTCSKNILEKDINLSVAKKLAQKLERDDLTIVMTREEDVKVGLADRVKIANDAKATLFVSIHCNYCKEDRSVKGLECYYQEDAMDGRALAESIVEEFEGIEDIINRGTRTGDLKVLRETEMPAALVEVGFLSNKGECQKLVDEEYQNLLAEKIAAGVLAQIEF